MARLPDCGLCVALCAMAADASEEIGDVAARTRAIAALEAATTSGVCDPSEGNNSDCVGIRTTYKDGREPPRATAP